MKEGKCDERGKEGGMDLKEGWKDGKEGMNGRRNRGRREYSNVEREGERL